MEIKRNIILKETSDTRVIFRTFGLYKFLFPAFGFLFFNIPGLIIGLILGMLMDITVLKKSVPPKPADIRITFLMLGTELMKADGEIDYEELVYISSFFRENFGNEFVEHQMGLVHEFARQRIDVESICAQLNYHLGYPQKLQLLYFLFGIAFSTGRIIAAENELIRKITTLLQIEDKDYHSIKAMHFTVQTPESAYTILEIDQNASDNEVKKAYYKLAKKYHPDKVEEFSREMAKEKFQKLQDAYSKIRRERGMK